MTFPPPTPEEIEQERRAAVSRSAAALGNFAAGQRPARVRARRQKKAGDRQSQASKKSPASRTIKLSERGFGTELRTDPVFLGLQKTRLLDPLLSFPGTNDQPGDYRASGCTRLPRGLRQRSLAGALRALTRSSAIWARAPPPIPRFRKNESGHPIKHEFTRSIPSSQCMVCHIHPGTNMVATYFGYTWWDNETDGEHMYPAAAAQSQRRASATRSQLRNPEARRCARPVDRRRISGEDRHARVQRATQAHAVRRLPRPRLDLPRRLQARPQGQPARRRTTRSSPFDDPEKFDKAVHLKDIHLEKGMHCIDCHFEQDSHGNGKLYGETAQRGRDRLRRLPRHDSSNAPR